MTNNIIIFEIENRGMCFLYHWFMYILSSFRHLEDKYNNRKTIIYMPWFKEKNIYNYYEESLKYFENKFIFITEPIDIKNFSNNSKHVLFHGEPLITGDMVSTCALNYLRNIFLNKKTYEFKPGKYVYISRNGSENLPHVQEIFKTKKRQRQIFNYNRVKEALSIYNFEFINLEDLNMEQKIELFQTSDIIMAPLSGCLTMSVFANEKTTIVEIYPLEHVNIGELRHYHNLCNQIGIDYCNFTDIDYCDNPKDVNMHIEIDKLHIFVKKLIYKKLQNKYREPIIAPKIK